MNISIVRKVWPYLLLGLICLAFFYKFFFHGLVPLPLDIIVGMYFPWLNKKWGYQVGVPVKNHIISDVVSQNWIWRNWAVELLKKGKIAIWNPHSLAGYPMAPWFHTIIFSPVNIFYFLTDKLTAMGLAVISQIVIGLLSMFLFLKEIINKNLPAVFGAVSFAFSAYFIGWLTWGTISLTIAFIPLVLFFSERLKTKFNYKNIIGLVTAYLFGFLAGYPQAFWHLNLILVVYLGFNVRKYKFEEKKLLILSLLLVLGAASLVWLPSLEILNLSIRGKETYLANYNFGFLPLSKQIILIFAPNFFGNPASGNYWGGGLNYMEYLIWFGTTALFSAIIGLYSVRRKLKNFSLSLIVLGLLLSLKYPIGFLIYKLNLPLLSAIPAGRNLFLVTFGGTIMAGLGLEKIINLEVDFNQWKKLVVVWIGFLAGLGLGLGVNYKIINGDKIYSSSMIIKNILANIRVSFRNSAIPLTVGLMTIIGVGMLLKLKKRLFANFLSLGLIGLAVIEGFYFGWKFTPFTKRKMYFPQTQSLKYLEEAKKRSDFFRIGREKGELLPPNMWMAYDLYSSAGYDPVYPQRYADWLKDNQALGSYSRYVEWDKPQEFFDRLGVKYYLVLKRDDKGELTKSGGLPYSIDKDQWKEVHNNGPVAVLENLNYQPPYQLQSGNGRIDLKEKRHNYWKFDAEVGQNDKLILMENNFPGWKVFVDGKLQKLEIFDQTFKGVSLNEGEHQVEFIYGNSLLKIGKFVSLGSILGLIFVIIKRKQ